MNPKALPVLLIVIYLAQSAISWSAGDWRRGMYWMAAAVITVSVTW